MTDNTDLNEVERVAIIYPDRYYLVELGEKGKGNNKIVLVFPCMETQYPVGKIFYSGLLMEAICKSMRDSFELFEKLGGTRAIAIRRPLKPIVKKALETLKNNDSEFTVTKSEPLIVTEEET